MSNITKYDDDVARIMRDPVLWAEKHIGQKPRWYQEQILRHPHNRIVLRCGRRLGKCIAGDQRILNTDTGSYETLDSLYNSQQKSVPLYSLQEDYKIAETKSLHIQDNGVKPTFKLRLKHGSEVTLTGNHPVLTIEGWKEVDAVKVGESIAVPKALPVFGKEAPGLSYVKMVGYIMGAHQHTTKGDILSFYSDETAREIQETAAENGILLVQKTPRNSFYFDESGKFAHIIEEKQQGLPKEVFTYDKEHLAVFLSALYDANGWSYAKRIAEIGIGTRNQRFAKEIKHLLLRFGIDANIVERELTGTPYFQVMLYSRKQIISFAEQIAIHGLKDYSNAVERSKEMVSKENTLPLAIWKYIEKERKEKGLKKNEVTGDKAEKFRVNVGLSEEKARRYADNLQSTFLYDLGRSDINWEEITSITPVGEQQTYDVFVPETHNLIVEDVLVHNTWTMAAHMLWVAFTGNGGKITQGGATCVVATPYDSQAKLIFDQLRNFIDENEVLRNSVSSITKNPYYIEFKNKGVIKLFTAGTKNGSGGASLRGQKADS